MQQKNIKHAMLLTLQHTGTASDRLLSAAWGMYALYSEHFIRRLFITLSLQCAAVISISLT